MIRAVSPADLAGGLLLALLIATTASAQAPQSPPQPAQVQPGLQQPGPAQPAQAPRGAPAAQPVPQAGTTPGQPRPAGGVAPTATDRIAFDQTRPRTYARCNRAALRRALKGGERRRFITRCRLGYTVPPRAR